MALDKNDKKEMSVIVCEAIEKLVLPQLEEIREDISDVKDDISNIQDTTTRTELKLNSVVKRQDNHSD